jgi:acyl carrier protein
VTGSADATWERFADEVAVLGKIPRDSVTPQAKLGEDLGLDSLAMAEVVALAIEEYNAAQLARDIENRDWDGMTLGELYAECAGRSADA